MERINQNALNNLDASISSLETAFHHPTFPRKLRPPENWSKGIRIQEPSEFDEDFLKSVKNDKHPYTWDALKKNDPDFEETLKRQIQSVRARVVFDDPQNQYIAVRLSDWFIYSRPSDVFLNLAHELGHLSAGVKEEPLIDSEIEKLEPLIEEVQQKGYSVDPSQLKLRKQGGNRFVTLDGKRLFAFASFGKFYGIFLDEFYADIHKSFVFTQLLMARGVKMEDAKKTYKLVLGMDRGVEATYTLKLVEYAERVGWTELVTAGIDCDLDKFLAPGTEIFGADEHKNKLDELQALRGRFSLIN